MDPGLDGTVEVPAWLVYSVLREEAGSPWRVFLDRTTGQLATLTYDESIEVELLADSVLANRRARERVERHPESFAEIPFPTEEQWSGWVRELLRETGKPESCVPRFEGLRTFFPNKGDRRLWTIFYRRKLVDLYTNAANAAGLRPIVKWSRRDRRVR
ncbi:MAG TPA: hypothetical protein VFI25_03470 [Planctomycetota bacterium]|nr:hypothetical protein [Planctomycetota bacterium]